LTAQLLLLLLTRKTDKERTSLKRIIRRGSGKFTIDAPALPRGASLLVCGKQITKWNLRKWRSSLCVLGASASSAFRWTDYAHSTNPSIECVQWGQGKRRGRRDGENAEFLSLVA